MDKKLEKKRFTSRKIFTASSALIVLIGLISMVLATGGSSYRVEADRVSISTVLYDDFQEIISVQGSVEPATSIQIDAIEGGVVEEIFVEDGEQLNAGQPMMRLSNTAMKLDFMNRETQIVEQINNLRSTRISLDQNKRQVQEQLVEIDYQLTEHSRQWRIDSVLFADQVIATTEFEASKARLKYLRTRKALMTERLATDEAYRKSQLNNIDASVEMMERNLEAIRKNLENLVVKAPIEGQLNSFDHEIGQTKSRGENLGRIDVLDHFLVSVRVDQYYLNRVQNGQLAHTSISGKDYSMRISKILPTIVNNQFEVHLEFEDEKPAQIRRGQNVQVKLEISAKTKALMVERGAFYQSTGGKYVFVLNDENEATKRKVVLGSQNPNYIEVKEGLAEGERVITSSYNAFSEVERVILN